MRFYFLFHLTNNSIQMSTQYNKDNKRKKVTKSKNSIKRKENNINNNIMSKTLYVFKV